MPTHFTKIACKNKKPSAGFLHHQTPFYEGGNKKQKSWSHRFFMFIPHFNFQLSKIKKILTDATFPPQNKHLVGFNVKIQIYGHKYSFQNIHFAVLKDFGVISTV